jgi:hypothetical protein
LHQQHGLREQLDITDVVTVRAGDGDEFDVGRPDAELIELARASVFGRHQCVAFGSARACPSGIAATASGIPVSQSSRPLRVVNQVTVIGEIHRFADIDTGRPARNISGDTFPTFENVEFIDGRFGLRRGRRRRN